MNLQNERPLAQTAASNNTKSNSDKFMLNFGIRKRLISIANQMKNAAYKLENSDEILKKFYTEINKLRGEL